MLWARLTWQAPDPASIAFGLVRWLGVTAETDPTAAGALVLRLGETELDVRPWMREGTDDHPHPGGRLMFEPHRGPQPAGGAEGAPVALVGVAWSTVELDRGEAELSAWVTGSDLGSEPATRDGIDAHLGARTRVRWTHALPGGRIVFAEPSTEGRLAASLARDGEGPCALYVAPAVGLAAWLREARKAGFPVRAARRLEGPFGASVLLPPGSPAGPFVLVVDGSHDGPPVAMPGTIGA
jgi:hypothetical protein